ncbi:MAG: hypothetical protein ACRDS9_11260, partial [Pseudonocardiaceae bacterium]
KGGVPGVHSVLAEQDERHKLGPVVATRLTMTDVTWAHWGITPTASEDQRSSSRHESLLTILLGGSPLSLSGASEPGSAMAQPGAWISLDPQESELRDRTDALRDRVNSDPLLLWPRKWFEDKKKHFEDEKKNNNKDVVTFGTFVDTCHADKVVRFIVDGLKQCELTANRAELRRAPELLAAQMTLFACSVYLAPERAAGLIHGPLGEDLAAPGHAKIDLRFREHLGRYWLYATFSVGTHPPSIPLDSLAPAKSVDDCADASPLVDGLEELRDRYAGALRRGFQDILHAFFPTAQMTILDRKYQPPRFWMASSCDLTTTGAATENGRAVGQHELLKKLLRAPHPDTTGLGAGDIDGRARVFRRFISSPRWAHDRPVYLVLPFASTAVDQEDYLRLMIQTLSDLEADAATRLFDIATDIDIYRNQLNLYETIAAQGLALWDQVALFLPVARGSRLSDTHRLIELIHQVVLQGIADLEEEAAHAQHTIERIQDVADDLIDQFDREFTERPVPGRVAIRDSLVEAGYFDKARRAAQSVHEQSRQVRATYIALLDSMTYAFDERRARETDVLQWVALLLAIVLGLVSSWNEFLSNYIDNWSAGPWVGGGLAVIILAIVAVLVMRWRRSRLTTRGFDKRFEKLRNLLAAYSSDRLARLRAEDERVALDALVRDKAEFDKSESEGRGGIVTTAQDQALMDAAKDWHHFDKTLARETAALLDVLPAPPPRESDWMQRLPNADLKELHTRVEVWALRALLVTERPRQFYHSAQPWLTFLYRFFPITGEKPSQGSDWSATESQVSDYDFRLTVVNHCGCEPEHVPTLMRWGHRKVSELSNASQFVDQLEAIGLRAHMTNERFRKMMQNMNESLWDSKEFNALRDDVTERLGTARTLLGGGKFYYRRVCMDAQDSAKFGLTGFLRGVRTGVPEDCDLVRLGVEVRATRGELPPDLQDAIWRLSAYPSLREQHGIHPAGLAAPRAYDKSDAQMAVDDALVVWRHVDEWTGGKLGPPPEPSFTPGVVAGAAFPPV